MKRSRILAVVWFVALLAASGVLYWDDLRYFWQADDDAAWGTMTIGEPGQIPRLSDDGDTIVFVYPEEPTEWLHGWKTKRVRATRYQNQFLGFNIGFAFPTIPDQCDDPRLFRFMEKHQGAVYQGGGHPGAEMYVIFEDVKDRPQADRKLRAILPELDELVGTIEDRQRNLPELDEPGVRL